MLSKKALLFLVLAYALAWTLELGFFALGGRIDSGAFVAFAFVGMFTPATAAFITQRLIWKEPMRDLGVRNPRLSWLAIAWLLPLLLVGVALAVSLFLPGVSLMTGLDALAVALAGKVPPQQLADMQRELEHTLLAKPGVLLFLSLFQVLGAGPTINAVAGFGEELGWRGLLQRELEPLGFWRSSLVIGFFWGLWHLPLIVAGLNYPGHPVAGPIVMIAFTMLLSPLIGYVRLRAQSVLAAAVFHGTFNAAATLSIFLHGGTMFTSGITGVPGLVTILLANGALWLHLRRQPVPIIAA
ncbi:MAG: CPBP family intramembrane metalloprotease domain-containing protein [Verrucomicrobia bacterium]|nr:MAG: CPBP family intramembrane metalloprotease domain-containing protein [Verrucomicrobiota bacterium]